MRHLLLLLVLLPSWALAQTQRPDAQIQAALRYVEQEAPRYGLTQGDLTDVAVTDAYTSRRSGTTHVYLRQRLDGLEVIGSEMGVHVGRSGEVFHRTGAFISDLEATATSRSAALSAEAAVSTAADHLGLTMTAPLALQRQAATADRGSTLSEAGIALEPIRARLVYAPTQQGALRQAWEVSIYQRDQQHYWVLYVDAQTGAELSRHDLVDHDLWSLPAAAASAGAEPGDHAEPHGHPPVARPEPAAGRLAGSYNVFAHPTESPSHGPRSLVANPANATASPFGWHDTDGTDGAEFTITRGNAVHAYQDRNDDGASAGDEPDGSPTLTFDFPLDLTQQPIQSIDAAVTNLFYWNNIIHDVLYHYGFDEAAGNFQQDNYGHGGLGGDYVQAEAQDGADICNSIFGCTNNANFATPPDGLRPRMQMYEFDQTTPRRDGDFDAGIIVHEYGHGVSNRLTGGPSNVGCLDNSEQMGEGWSDYLTLMLTGSGTDGRGMGIYVLGQATNGAGIRPARYSTDFAVNAYTYAHVGSLAIPHGVGFLWATMLWDMTKALIDDHGYDADIYDADGTAGNQIALQLVIEGMKLQPCSPGFVDGRDAILAADLSLYGGAHTDLIWEAFARRGLGYLADQGSSNSTSDGTADFAVPEFIAPSPVANLAAAPSPAGVVLTWTATGDDGPVGTASGYDVRYASTPILAEADFEAATPASGEPAPQAAGAAETFTVTGLDFETTYHFALRVRDDVGNLSGLSNSPSATTLGPPVGGADDAEILHALRAEETDSRTLRLTNTGPSDLTFQLSIVDTSPRPAASQHAPALTTAPQAPPLAARKGEYVVYDGIGPTRGTGGPDAYGYSWKDSNEPGGPAYAFVDISTTGTPLTFTPTSTFPAADEGYADVALPFAFPFYGASYPSVRVFSNGFLTFSNFASNSYSNGPIPNSSSPNALIAPFWDDLDASGGGAAIYAEDLGDGRFVIQYNAVPRWGTNAPNTFQVVLYLNGNILVQYEDMQGTRTNASVGIENAAGTDGLQVVYRAPYIENGLAVRFKTPLWVSSTPEVGSVPAGGTFDLDLGFDATGLANGTYTAELTLSTNDPAAPTHTIPLTLNVGDTAVGIAGQAGWRMMASPVADLAVADLAGQNLVQGLSDLYPEAAPNFYTGYDGAGWSAAATSAELLPPGHGFLWYLFDATFDPGGASRSVELPAGIAALGTGPGADVAVSLHASGDRWNLIGNPFMSGLDVSGLDTWPGALNLASAVVHVWDATVGTWLTTTALGGLVAEWQGFFIENDTAPALTIPASAQAPGGVFHRGGTPPRLVSFELTGTDAASGAPTTDRSLVLYFHPSATAEWDLWDALKLTPLSSAWATLAFEGTRNGEAVLKAQESRPLDPERFEVALAFEAQGTSESYTLRWPVFENIPETWSLTLRDEVTGAEVDLRTEEEYLFEATASRPALPVLEAKDQLQRQDASIAAPAVGALEQGRAQGRFVLEIATGAVTDTEGAAPPVSFGIEEVYPNPSPGRVSVTYGLDEEAAVRLAVYDVLGRRVALLVSMDQPAGRHEAVWEPEGMASGVYVLRLETGTQMATQKVLLVR